MLITTYLWHYIATSPITPHGGSGTPGELMLYRASVKEEEASNCSLVIGSNTQAGYER